MKRSFVLAIGMLAAGAASAITAHWEWTSNGSDWQTTSSIYMVYSESTLTADEVVQGANANYGQDEGAKNSVGGAWSTPSGTLPTTKAGSAETFPLLGNEGHVAVSGGEWATIGSGYFYLVIFNATTASEATEFAVAQAGETGYVKIEGTQVPGPTQTPDPILYLDPVWIGGTFRDAAPEPTALALLALGVAGAALRRRVR